MLTTGVCLIIVLVLIYYIIQSRKLAKYYLKLKNDVLNNKLEKNPTFKNKNIQNIYKEFEESLSQTSNVNTQVIIEKHMYIDSKTRNIENSLEYLVSFATVLGLLGTFIGLTGAIIQAAIVLQDVTNMDTFVKELRPAIESMGGAFITSIFGIVASAIMNFISFTNKNAYKVHKQEFIDEVESYLDNVVTGNRGETQVDKLLVSMTQSVNIMTEEVTRSIRKNMEQLTLTMDNSMNTLVDEIKKLNEKITVVSIDMKNSAESLDSTINKLENISKSFKEPVDLFKKSMDKFVDAYKGMDNKVEEMDDIVDKFIKYFNRNMQYQEDTQQAIENATKNLDSHIKLLNETCGYLNNIFEDTDKALRFSINNSNKSLEDINETMKKFNDSLDEMPMKVSDVTKEGIKVYTEVITKNVADILNATTNGLNENIKLNKDTLQVMKQTIQAIYDQVKDFEETVYNTR